LPFRKNNPSAALFRKPTAAELRAVGGSARDAVTDIARRAMSDGAGKARAGGARFSASKPAQLTAGIAVAATIGTLAAAGPWASAAPSTAAASTAPAGATSASAAPAGATSASTAPAGTASGSTADAARGGQAATIGPATHASSSQAKEKTAASAQPQTIYDSVAPTAIPVGQKVATYSNGPYQASGQAVSGRGNVLWIDVNGSNTRANALDVEPGDATPSEAASWVSAKLSASPHTDAIVYTFEAEWGSVQSNISALPSWMQSHVKYWIADPTGTPHIVPGASATQWYWGGNYDISMAKPGFFK
jgi:hypothetical protein